MTTSVRLTPQIERALSEYCARKGVTKSEVISKAIIDYVITDVHYSIKTGNEDKVAEPSPIYTAFVKSGLIGVGGAQAPASGVGATKARVREAVRAKLKRPANT